MRNCTGGGGGPSEVGNLCPVSNYVQSAPALRSRRLTTGRPGQPFSLIIVRPDRRALFNGRFLAAGLFDGRVSIEPSERGFALLFDGGNRGRQQGGRKMLSRMGDARGELRLKPVTDRGRAPIYFAFDGGQHGIQSLVTTGKTLASIGDPCR